MYAALSAAFTLRSGVQPPSVRGNTTVWYEPLEEENVGHGGCHEVTGDVYKHITGSAQRRLSIERVGAKDGAFLATFGKGAIGRLVWPGSPVSSRDGEVG